MKSWLMLVCGLFSLLSVSGYAASRSPPPNTGSVNVVNQTDSDYVYFEFYSSGLSHKCHESGWLKAGGQSTYKPGSGCNSPYTVIVCQGDECALTLCTVPVKLIGENQTVFAYGPNSCQ